MSNIKVIAGPFVLGAARVKDEKILFPVDGEFWPEEIKISDIEFEIATEETVKKAAGTVGWGAAGALALGPVGLLAGLLLGGRKKEVTFIGKIVDGRKFLASSDNKTYVKLRAGTF
ncbi:hypothetical protein [Pseudohongiella sp.]|uniref:Uncharacterized protein n=1 Tax=marine sediment metagenome TaxID=412755 RepID=A0A0F9YQ91_9ZZZZ|nr:hypothetical protein [Pseudohongiella sp.]HDZ10045.1 hypothetical protein [Pseudohongiella sp.]HEA63394.1 hypothetical protein [Pseudohongiella sp.]